MIIKKILSFVVSIISLFILQLFLLPNSNSEEDNIKYYSNDNGILSLMYHRFNENKYPSTNIRMNVFKDQMQMIKNLDYSFSDPNFFISKFDKPKIKKPSKKMFNLNYLKNMNNSLEKIVLSKYPKLNEINGSINSRSPFTPNT